MAAWLCSSEIDGHPLLSAFQSNGEQLGTTPAERSRRVRALLKAFSLLLRNNTGTLHKPSLAGKSPVKIGLKRGLWVDAKIRNCEMNNCQRAQESFQPQQDQSETSTNSVESVLREDLCLTH